MKDKKNYENIEILLKKIIDLEKEKYFSPIQIEFDFEIKQMICGANETTILSGKKKQKNKIKEK
jgi:hypothetical protein